MVKPYRLIYRDPAPDNVWINPLWLDTDGRLTFDTGLDFNLSLSKEITKLTDINKITVDTVLDTSLPATAKNLALLGISMDVEVIDNTYPDHDVEVEMGPASLFQNKLRIVGYNRQSNSIEIQLIHGSDFWIEGIKNTYLDELELGTFEYLDQNLIDNFKNNAKYLDGDPGYYFGHVFYGKYINVPKGRKPVLNPADFRPLVHALKVLQLGFCEAGWKFSSPILETDTGRRIVSYVNSENFVNSEADLERIKFKGAINGTSKVKIGGTTKQILATQLYRTNGDQKLKCNVEIIDNGNNYDTATGIFSKAGVFDFVAKITLHALIGKAGATEGASVINFKLVHEYSDGTVAAVDIFDTLNTREHTEFHDSFTLTAFDETVNVGDKVYLSYYIGGKRIGYVFVESGSTFEAVPKRNLLQGGDTIDIGANLRHDSILDFAKGISHLFNFHWLTDYTTQTVYALTPFDLDFFGETVEGYFNSSLKDYKTKMLTDSERYTQIEKEVKNRIYAFKKSTDAKIQSFKWDENEPYSRFVDNNQDKKDSDKNEVLENPYFEATFSADTGLDQNGGLLEAPWMVDNLDGNLSFNIEPRILIAAGWEMLWYPTSKSATAIPDVARYDLFTFGQQYQLLPHVYQKCNQATGIQGAYPNIEYTYPDRKLAYGYFEDDLYEMIYKKYDLYFRDNPVINFRAILSPEDFYSENFRTRARIYSPNIHNGDLMGRISKVNSFDALTGLAELEFIADKQTMNECLGFEVPLSCNNFPTIIDTKVGQVHTFSVGGQIESDIDTETWQYRPVGRSWWTVGNVVNTPTQDTQVQLIMTFTTGCPSITLPYLIKVRLEPEITLTKVGNIVEAQETGTHELTVSDTKIYYSEDGNNWKEYNTGIDLTKITSDNIYWDVVVTYSDGQERSKQTVMSTQPNENDCPNPDLQQYPPTVIVSKIPGQSYFPYKTGEYTGCSVYDQIVYREKNKNQEWVVYSNEIISLQKCWEFQRRIVWCKEGCMPYCSPNVYSDCGACVSAATLGTTQSSATCTHEQKYENPDTPGSATWKVEPIDNKTYHIPSIRTWIEQNAGSPVEIQEQTVIWREWNFRTEYVYTWNIGYKVAMINVTVADTLGIGNQYSLNIQVPYESGNTNDQLTEALKSAIISQLSELEFSENLHYELYVSVTGTTTKTLNLGFLAKHNPVNSWIGINKGVDVLTAENPDTTFSTTSATGKEYQKESNSQPILNNYSPYGTNFKIRFKVSTVNYFLDDSASNFNSLVANASTPILTDILSTGLTDTGKKYTLGASFTGCPTTSIWQWLYGGVKKGELGIVFSRSDSATAYIQANTEVICLGTCQSTGYCVQEKRLMLTV